MCALVNYALALVKQSQPGGTREARAGLTIGSTCACVYKVDVYTGRTCLQAGRVYRVDIRFVLAYTVWILGTWSHLRVVRVREHVPEALRCLCLAVSGSVLLCGGQCNGDRFGFVLVLDTDTLTCQHTLRLDSLVGRLLSVRGEVWGILGDSKLVVWGKAERGERDRA